MSLNIVLTTHNHLTHPKYRPDIDGLRAIAILSVVGFHAFPNWIHGGFIGVDIFFVISGYLISTIIMSSLERNSFSFVDFYIRRINRIFPALLLVLTACFVLGWFSLLADEYKQLGKHIAGGAGFISNFLFWSESGYFDNVAETKPLLHLWSLGIEEQFYIIWPPLLWFAGKIKFNLLTVTIVVAVISFALNIAKINGGQIESAFYLPQTRFWELLIGSVLAYTTLHRLSLFPKLKLQLDTWLSKINCANTPEAAEKILCNVQSILGAAILVIGVLVINREGRFPGWWAVLPTLGAVLIISSGAQAWFNRVLSNRVLVWFGLISFPLYLWHWPLLSFARIVDSATPSPVIRMVVLLISIVLAWLTYLVIEKPFRFGCRGNLKSLALVLSMVAIGYVGYSTYKHEGFAFRVEKLERLQEQFAFTADLGRPADAQIMLLGDSHAAHLIPGLKKEFGQQVANYTMAGCIPFYNVDRYDSRFTPGTCMNFVNYALTMLMHSNKLNTVILSSMGPVYLTGEGFKGYDARVIGLGVTLKGRPDLTNRWEIYKLGMKNTLSGLLALNKQIIFVLDIPELPFDARHCVENRPLSFASIIQKPCAFPRHEYDIRVAEYKALVVDVLKEYPQVKFFDPTEYFCDKQWCWATRDGKMLYRNTDHLSNEGSNYIVKFLAPVIRETLSKK